MKFSISLKLRTSKKISSKYPVCEFPKDTRELTEIRNHIRNVPSAVEGSDKTADCTPEANNSLRKVVNKLPGTEQKLRLKLWIQ